MLAGSGGVDLWQLLPERALPEWQFLVVQTIHNELGWALTEADGSDIAADADRYALLHASVKPSA
jgi:hypothetical protein